MEEMVRQAVERRQPSLVKCGSATVPWSPRSMRPCDGRDLHSRVPSSHWCVTQQDLADFRRIVQRAVQKGSVVPTPQDSFDPKDDRIGPRIFTVNEQLIKPMTARLGNPSWALMLHPEGLECDLFITHCWSEGVYEFVDKVLHSWPRSAKNAYICMLSNPQNLDIGGLISQPTNSPFALALRSARCMLVVPNSTCSIYTRIWCVYEAFLSYTHNKPIFTATPPIKGMLGRLVVLLTLFGIAWGCTFLVYYKDLVSKSPMASLPLMVVVSLTAFGSLLLRTTSRALRWVNDLGAVVCGVTSAYCFVMLGAEGGVFAVVPAPISAFFYGITSLFFAAREADRLTDTQKSVQASQLLRGFTGRLEDAQSSMEVDRRKILSEIRTRQEEAAVEQAIGVLIAAGMSTPSLRAAASHGVDISGAGWWSWAQLVVILMIFVAHPLAHGVADISCGGAWSFVPWLKAAEGLIWVNCFAWVGPDQRGFAAAVAMKLGAIPYFIGWSTCITILFFLGKLHTRSSCAPDMVGAFLWGPLMLWMSFLGVGKSAALPVVGPTLTNVLLHVRWRPRQQLQLETLCEEEDEGEGDDDSSDSDQSDSDEEKLGPRSPLAAN